MHMTSAHKILGALESFSIEHVCNLHGFHMEILDKRVVELTW